ncbi:MAG TPA: hypothetical protein VMJ34_23390 [Bryobacteraceae bacterium]|nr:hypothetical protein [Bryobacteraceae bacterium]
MRIALLALSAFISTGLFVNAQTSIDDSLQSLRDAVTAKDVDKVKTLAASVSEAATKITSGPEPTTEIDKDQVARAKDAQSYAEYALYTTALASDAATRVDLFATLEQIGPASKYLNDGYAYYFQSLTLTGDTAKIPAIAEKALKSLPSSPDVLAQLMNLAAQKSQNDKAASYAQKLIAVLAKRPKSEIMPDAEWAKKKTGMLGSAHMVSGLILVAQGKNYRADQELRAALPLVSDDMQKAAVLFNLALSNYNLGSVGLNRAQVLDAAKFSQQCAAIKSQYQDQCAHNVTAMKAYAANMH